MIGPLHKIQAAFSCAAGAAVMFGLSSVYDSFVDDPAVRETAILQERQAWEEQRLRAIARQDDRRRQAQVKIDAAAWDYLNRRAADAIRYAKPLQELNKKEPEGDAVDDSCPRRPFFSRRVSRALNEIGRRAD